MKLKNSIIATLVLALSLCTGAFANSNHTCQGNSCNGTTAPASTTNNNNTSSSNPAIGTVSTSGITEGAVSTFSPTSTSNSSATGGNSTSISQGGAGGQGGSVKDSGNSSSSSSVKNSGNSSNTNVNVAQGGKGGSAKQGQQQGQLQGQTQSSASTSTAVNGGQQNSQSTTYVQEQVHQAPTVFTPEAYPSAPCRVSTSVGGSSPLGGMSFGSSKLDEQCDKRETARSFALIGQPDAALQILCSTKAAKAAKIAACSTK